MTDLFIIQKEEDIIKAQETLKKLIEAFKYCNNVSNDFDQRQYDLIGTLDVNVYKLQHMCIDLMNEIDTWKQNTGNPYDH